MRKKCVRWTKSVLAALIGAFAWSQVPQGTAVAQSTNPSELPRLAFEDVQYVGAFRLPRDMSNDDSFSIGGETLAFNPAGPSLFVGSKAGRVAELSIPVPVASSNPDALPFATFIQPLTDPMEGRLSAVATDGVALDGLMVHGNRLYGSVSVYYDAQNTQRMSHFSHSLRLNEASFTGWSSVWQTDRTGFVSGFMAKIPSEWRTLLGGPAITGQCCVPIVSRTSWGPAAFAFDPARVGDPLVPASPLLYYTGANPTLGHWDSSSPTYGASTTMGGVVIIPGTRTALYFGANGIGPNCYGNGTGNQSLHGTTGPDGTLWCYDPSNSAKGSHAYPYRYQMWAYDLNDFAAVKAGQKQPWEVVPYGVWPFDLPTPETTVRLGGVDYDPTSRTLYLSQMFADRDGYGYRAIVHALHVNVGNRAAVPAAAVAITSHLTAPQQPGTTLRFTAAVSGGTAPHEYKWMTYDGAQWSASPWSTSNVFAVTPEAPNAGYRIGVWARSAGTTADDAEASASIDFPIDANPGGDSRVASVSLTPSLPSPQPVNTQITWTASATGGSGALQYQWWTYDGSNWSSQPWTGSKTFVWTPSSANASYRVAVWVKSANNGGWHEAAVEAWYTITGAAAPASARVNSVTLASSVPSPQPVGTTISWTAAASGGVAPLQYQWWVYDGASWSSQPWSTANTFSWRPATEGSSHRVAVWVRSAGSTGGADASVESWFTITSATIPAPAARTTGVTLSANLRAPQRPNTTVVWTATPRGGASPHQYQWWVFDGNDWTSQPWTTSNTFTWKPAVANPHYRVAVWVRSAGNTDAHETSTEAWFAITGSPGR
jgi:hypothetical protein